MCARRFTSQNTRHVTAAFQHASRRTHKRTRAPAPPRNCPKTKTKAKTKTYCGVGKWGEKTGPGQLTQFLLGAGPLPWRLKRCAKKVGVALPPVRLRKGRPSPSGVSPSAARRAPPGSRARSAAPAQRPAGPTHANRARTAGDRRRRKRLLPWRN